eukprot:PITA_18112
MNHYSNPCKTVSHTSVAIGHLNLQGFLSISCGAKTNHTGENNITWIPDAHYIDVGQSADMGNVTSEEAYGSYLHRMRYFPKPLNKSCYQLPVAADVPHLLRLWFYAGNFSGYAGPSSDFAFSIETVDMLASRNVSGNDIPSLYEHILVTKGRVLYICLVRTSETDDPFISAIEIRRLQHGMYTDAQPGTILFTVSRFDAGGNSMVRYPHDNFDRIWMSAVDTFMLDPQNVTSKRPISTNNTKDFPPTAVLQTAWVIDSSNASIPLQYSGSFDGEFRSDQTDRTLLLLYFAELETLNMYKSRSFSVKINGEESEIITLVPKYSAQEVTIQSSPVAYSFSLIEGSESTLPPIINAFEYYQLLQSHQPTYSYDIDALNAIKSQFDIKDWISPDPCYLVPWDGIGCGSSNYRGVTIFEIDLSGRNLTGPVPSDFAMLTALVNLSLHHNHLTGRTPLYFGNLTVLEGLYLQNNNFNGHLEWLPFQTSLRELSLDHNNFTGPVPNLTNLISLERLYLQKNNLSGPVEWLSPLISLQELSLDDNDFTGPMPNLANLTKLERLNIENNNFSGVFPAQLLLNCSLKLNYSGNPYLRVGTRECNLKEKKNENTKLIVVLGILFIALIVDQYIKLTIKKESVATKSSAAQKDPNDHSMNMVPNATKSRAFTLDEMRAATQSFSQEIGRGGFGSVFFGKLPQGKLIAVKVLSQLSGQGIQEFLNEVDLLSKINHRNLVSLLGYCNETDEVMLVYEHMSGGTLRDHLYGPRAENSDLNWKRRLNIALDAAQGLEYLHVGCNPKIIHRDVKTANILLDTNLNGKLADFGLSKMIIDGEATHVTTVVKGTFGYLDPEYFNTRMLTEKSDVYSFGVVLLEILSGRAPIDTNLPEEEINIVRWVTPYLLETDENGGKIIDVIDKRLCGGYDMKSVSNVAKIAMRCLQALPSRRPTVSEVVAELKEAIKVEEDKDCISIAEENGIQNGDVSTKREGMEWSDNSCNMSNVGR